MKFFGISLLTLVSIFGCATAPTIKPTAVSNAAYLSDTAPASANLHEMDDDLSRNTKTHGVSVNAIPLTGAYVETIIRDQGYKEGLSSIDTEKKLADMKKLTSGKMCFITSFSSETKDATVLKYWGIELIDQHLKIHNMAYLDKEHLPESKTDTNVGSYSTGGYQMGHYYIPQTTNVYSYNKTHHSNSGVVCMVKSDSVNPKDNFSLKLTPRFDRDLHPIYLVWKREEQAKN